MDINKIKERFEKRKNVTEKALENFNAICEWVTIVVDNVNLTVEPSINYRGQRWVDHGHRTEKTSSDEYTMNLCIRSGKCGLYLDIYSGYSEEIESSDIFYIRLCELKEALFNLFEELEMFSIREESARKIETIKKLLK